MPYALYVCHGFVSASLANGEKGTGMSSEDLDLIWDGLMEMFEDRVLPVDAGVCERWADLMATAGTPLAAVDSLIAATAVHANLVVATRNVKDFARMEVNVFNPWTFED